MTEKALMSSNENENGKPLMPLKDGNENGNENDKTMSSKKDDNETMNQNNNDIIKQLNNFLDEIIDKSKSFEGQIKSIKKVKDLNEYYYISDYDNKELKFTIFKLRLAHLSNIIDKKLFEQIFGHKIETLANKLINATNKEENQIIVNNINENTKKVKQDLFMIMRSNQAIDVII